MLPPAGWDPTRTDQLRAEERRGARPDNEDVRAAVGRRPFAQVSALGKLDELPKLHSRIGVACKLTFDLARDREMIPRGFGEGGTRFIVLHT